MDRLTWEIDKSVQLSGSKVAQCGTRAGAEEHRPQFCLTRNRPGEDRIDAPVQLLPAPAFEARVNELAGYTSSKQLLSGNSA